MSAPFTLSAAQYPIGEPGSFAEWEDKLSRWVADAAAAGSSLAVFPEYASLELAAIDPRARSDLAWSLAWMADRRGEIDALHRRLAIEHRLTICAGSIPDRMADGRYRNLARLFSPTGAMGEQPKQIMTRFEREQWGVASDPSLCVFDTPVGRIGIAICYDMEFPLIARTLVEAGAMILLAPSCTDSLHGYHRVRIGAAARALENQCYVVQSPTVGDAPWSPSLDENHGAAAVFAPADRGFPADGVVAMGVLDQPQWLHVAIDPTLIDTVRQEGAVFNHRHWPEQPGAAGWQVPQVSIIDLR